MKTTKRRSTKTTLKKKLWKIFSEYVRRRDADQHGFNTCITCGNKLHWKQLQAGHYVRKSAGMSVYFEEKNVFPQCYACNIWRDGNTDEYALVLQRKFGENILKELNILKHKIIKDFPFETKITYYTDLLDRLPKTDPTL